MNGKLRYALVPVLMSLWLSGCGYPEGGYGEAQESPLRQAVREYEEQMAQLGGPPPRERTGNVIVLLEHHVYDTQSSVQVSSAWRYVDEKLAAGSRSGRLWGRNGLRLGLAGEGFRGALKVRARGEQRTVSQQMMLTALSGQEASLTVGTDVYVPALRYWTWSGPVTLFERELVGSSLVVVPQLVGEDQIHLKLFPRFTSQAGRRTFDVTELTTEVVVPHGRTLVVGAMDESLGGLGWALFSLGRNQGDRRTLLLVTPYIEAAK